MKKTLCVLICLLLVSLLTAASAQTVEPQMPAMLRDLVAGKTFIGRMEGYLSDDEMEHGSLYLQICEPELYPAEQVEALTAGDIIVVGNADFVIKEIKPNEFGGYDVTGEGYDIFLYKNEDGSYYAITDTENRFYKDVFAIEARPGENFRFLNWSDPEAEQPVELTLHDLLKLYSEDQFNSIEDNTKFTFDENGYLSELVYNYSPWN